LIKDTVELYAHVAEDKKVSLTTSSPNDLLLTLTQTECGK